MNSASLRRPVHRTVPVAQALRLTGRAAVLALYHELALAPKPGLVSFIDSGSHEDMDANTFMRSLFALRSYFGSIAHAGARGATLTELEILGRQAEGRMLAATAGVNTHRGAIFSLGLLCAAAGRQVAQGGHTDAASLRASLLEGWGAALRERAARRLSSASSQGQSAARSFGLQSAGEEAAEGFPVLFEVTLPVLRATQHRGASAGAAMVQALMATIAALDDTNLAHRGGLAGLRFAQGEARAFLQGGGVLRPGWRNEAAAMHERFVARRLSPGGSADLLGCAWWLDRMGGTEFHSP
jgi:triphosphoribosyl-dephospho-CoA synthase